MIENITAMTPAEIDKDLYETLVTLGRHESRRDNALASVQRLVLATYPDHRHYDFEAPKLTDAEAAERVPLLTWSYDRDRANQLLTLAADAQALITPLEARENQVYDEFNRRGGWSRAWLCITNGRGHVHRGRGCNSLRVTTQLALCWEWSGADEAKIVDDAGERACTICYSTAPLLKDALNKPTKMFTEDEITAQAERDERARKKAEKDAQRVHVELWDERGRLGWQKRAEVINTPRSAMLRATDEVVRLGVAIARAWGEEQAYRRQNIRTLAEALAAHGDAVDVLTVQAEIMAKGRVKFAKRTGRQGLTITL